jgi:hypothetical protein
VLPEVKALHPWNRAPAFRKAVIERKSDIGDCISVAERVARASLDAYGPVIRIDGGQLTVDQGDASDTHFGVDLAEESTGAFDRFIEVLDILVAKRKHYGIEIARSWTLSVQDDVDVVAKDVLGRLVYSANHAGFPTFRLARQGAGSVWLVEGAPGLHGLPDPQPIGVDVHLSGPDGGLSIWLGAKGGANSLGGAACPWQRIPAGPSKDQATAAVAALQALDLPADARLRLVTEERVPLATVAEVGAQWEAAGRQVTVGAPEGEGTCSPVAPDAVAWRAALGRDSGAGAGEAKATQ